MGPVCHILITGQKGAASFYLLNICLYPLHTLGGDFKHRANLNISVPVDDRQEGQVVLSLNSLRWGWGYFRPSITIGLRSTSKEQKEREEGRATGGNTS